MKETALPLDGRVIAIPETRQMEVLAALLEARGARALRCPLVAIRDAENPEPVVAWIDRLVTTPAGLVVFYTGEGVRRLAALAERTGRLEAFVTALETTRKLCRGPKPKRALREIGLQSELDAVSPTTDGVVETLATLDLGTLRAAIQLYSDAPPAALARYIATAGIEADYVSPYVYASQSDDARVVELIGELGQGRVDAIAFTSKAQVERLFDVAARAGLGEALAAGLGKTHIAAVGPVVAAELRGAGFEVDAEPERNYFLKPLVAKLCELFSDRVK